MASVGNIQTFVDGTNDSQTIGSAALTDYVLACKPRYHFASGGSFFEREPYRNPTPDFDGSIPITRFIGLAHFDATVRDKKEKVTLTSISTALTLA